MSKKYNSKETIDKIINISAKLFIEKGYDKTTMQDIVSELGMSKGAIFHHFHSKEEILEKVIDMIAESSEALINSWIEELKDLNAKDKLTTILKRNITEQKLHEFDKTFANQSTNAKFALSNIQENLKKSVPIFEKLIVEGNKDGSCSVLYPKECAEAFFLLMNFWCDPLIFECDIKSLKNRILTTQLIIKSLGADIIDDEIVNLTVEMIENIKKLNSN